MPSNADRSYGPKQIVYLWGAGATQAEISFRGAHHVNLLMRDSSLASGVATRILQQLPKKWQVSFGADQATDIEKLISLLAASAATTYQRLAQEIRQLYFNDICRHLAVAGVLSDPTLAIGILRMHKNELFARHETLSGIITTNHDGLLQLAAQRVHAEVDIGIPFASNEVTQSASRVAPILHLHGSFTWSFGVPLRVSLLSEHSQYSSETVWIPPAILKDSRHYPFNKLAGLAYELLAKRCDVLRVVGSSLTQNDWNVLSMIFHAQRHRELTNATPFRIELIMSQNAGVEIVKGCSYLRNLTPIGQLTDGEFADWKEEQSVTPQMGNPLVYWMRQKIDFHSRRGDLGPAPLEATLARIAGDTP